MQDCLQYLGQKDDTSRFVGLTLLLSLMRQLDETHYQDFMIQCTQVLDGRFLDRLLKTGIGEAPTILLASA